MSVIIPITGLPRSFTSALVRAVGLCGACMVESESPDFQAWNGATGFAEDMAFSRLSTLLNVADPHPDPDGDCDEVLAAEVARRSAAYRAWGFKCHRPYRMLSKMLDMGLTLKPVCIHRPIEQSIASYAERSGEPVDSVRRRFTEMEADIVAACQLAPTLRIEADDLLADPRKELSKITYWAGLTLTDEAVAYIDPSRRRF